MPLFEFVCRACGQRFESFVTLARIPICPACGSTAADKQVSTFSAHGTGARPTRSKFT